MIGMARAGLFAVALASAACLVTSPAHASVGVEKVSIVEGETFEFSPFSFEVHFTQSVQLVHARLIDQEGRDAPLDLSFYRKRAQSFVIELPVLLPHGYRLSWRVRPASGADQQGSVGFIVKGCLDPRAAR
jgi:methionine-rich copper-binding protein CopC